MFASGQPLTLGRIVADCARHFADDPAVICGDQRRTHAELYANGCRLAAALAARGLRRQDRMAVLSMNNLEFIEAYYAGWTAGFVVATVNFRLALPEIIAILEDIAPRVLLVEDQYLVMVPAIRKALPQIETVVVIGGDVPDAQGDTFAYDAFVAAAPVVPPAMVATEDDIASLIYTSGTTGKAKGCVMGQRENAFNTQVLAVSMANVPGDRFLCVMPLFHIGAMAVALAILAAGGTVIVHRQFDPAAAVEALVDERITHALLAPTMVHLLLQQPDLDQRDFSALRMIVYSAAPMPSNTLRRGMAVFGRVFLQMLGSSEGSSIAWLPMAMHRPDGTPEEQQRLASTGFPYFFTGVRIVDDEGHDLPANVPGEIAIRSPVMFRGYWNNPEATEAAIREGWYFTGDVGYLDEAGYLYLVDRKKDMIISGGENIYPREVEEALVQHPAVSEVAVIGRADEAWGETVCAVVVAIAGATVTAEELIEHTRKLIAGYKKPRHILFVPELPKVASGKIDKKVLRDLYGRSA